MRFKLCRCMHEQGKGQEGTAVSKRLRRPNEPNEQMIVGPAPAIQSITGPSEATVNCVLNTAYSILCSVYSVQCKVSILQYIVYKS